MYLYIHFYILLFEIYFLNRVYNIMERGLVMLLHSVIIGILLYAIMVFLLGQSQAVAENRSLLLGAVMLIYMILFGHGLPTRINKSVL
jgi:hypothetical protein